MRDPAYVAIATVWVLGSTWSILIGRGGARVAGAFLLLQLVVEFLAYLIAPRILTRPVTQVSDLALLLFFLVVAYRQRITWPAAGAGGQAFSIALSAARAWMPHVHRWAMVTALDLAGFVVLGAVMAGAWTSRRRRA